MNRTQLSLGTAEDEFTSYLMHIRFSLFYHYHIEYQCKDKIAEKDMKLSQNVARNTFVL
jgi:hypothetical protein